METKNKGPLNMFYLTGLKEEFSADNVYRPNPEFQKECARLFNGYTPAA